MRKIWLMFGIMPIILGGCAALTGPVAMVLGQASSVVQTVLAGSPSDETVVEHGGPK